MAEPEPLTYVLGESPHVTAQFFVGTTLTDPSTVTLIVEAPDGTQTTYTGAPIVHVSTGTYSADLDPTVVGLWNYRWSSTGTAKGANEGSFYVTSRLGSPIRYTYEPSTDIGKVRLLIDDRDMSAVSLNLPLEQRSVIFADAEIQTFLNLNGGDVLLGAAGATRTIAMNRSLLVQHRKISKTEVDFGTLRQDLMKMAAEFERVARETPADGLAEIAWTDPALRQLLINQALRNNP